MNDSRLVTIEQPWKFRTRESQPDWVHLPKLRLLLGWGPGIREAFGVTLLGLRTVIIPEQADISRPPLKWLMTWYDDHFLFNTLLRENAPSLAVFGAGEQCHSYKLKHDGLHKEHLEAAKNGRFPVSTASDFRVRYAADESGPSLIVTRRIKRLKEKYQERMRQLGLTYAPGTGKLSSSADGRRTPSEQRFVEFVSAIKRNYVEKRVRDLENHPGVRPLDYEDLRKAWVRSRLGEIQRGKRDRSGKGKRPYPEEELTRRVCSEIARRESEHEMYDHSWVDQLTFRPPCPTVLPPK